jgi:hypothetical protein
MKTDGFKLYRAKELTTQVAAFYNNFAGKSGIGSNKVIAAILNEWDPPLRAPHKYTDVMPIEKILIWLQNLGDNASLDRFTLYKKFLISLQICCIARTSDIFRLRFDTLTRDRPPGTLTFLTSTKTSKGKGFWYYLFEIPNSPRVCPVRTTLAFQRKFEEQATKNHWSLPPHFIHVGKKGAPIKSPAQLADILKAAYREAGIDTEKWKVNNSRHAVITFYKARGISEDQIKLITGHSVNSRVTRDFYTHPIKEWSDKSVLSMLSALSPSTSSPAAASSSDIPTPSAVSPTSEELSSPAWDLIADTEADSESVEVIISEKILRSQPASRTTPQDGNDRFSLNPPAPRIITDPLEKSGEKDE